MLKKTFQVESTIEATHWWFVARRELFSREIVRVGTSPLARVLDVGTSTGTNLRMLKDLGFNNVVGLDPSDDAIRYCKEKGLGFVQKGDITAMPFGDGSYDLIIATDVLEHVEDEFKALSEIYRLLAPNGKLLITVPCFPSLWGPQDDLALHKRRYFLNELCQQLSKSGLVPFRSYYFNYLLFVPIFIIRKTLRFFGIKVQNENLINTPFLNRTLLALFRFDIATAHFIKPPFGVSALVMAEKL